MQQPYWKQVEYEVPDNWWHSKDYYNVPLDDFMKIIKNAIKNGYTMAIGGDVSEAGYDSWTKVAVVPTFDIPSGSIRCQAFLFRLHCHQEAFFVPGLLLQDSYLQCQSSL